MKTRTVAETKAHLSALLAAVAKGEEVTVTRRGRPVARIVPAAATSGAFDLQALRDYVSAEPTQPGLTVTEMREHDQLRSTSIPPCWAHCSFGNPAQPN